MIDRGANGGIAGDNVCIIATTDCQVNVSGINNHQLTNLKIVTAGGVCPSNQGEVVVILHQYAYNPGHQTIHSSLQMEQFGNIVDDRSIAFGGSQTLQTLDGFILLFSFQNGLPYLPIRPFSNHEWDTLPHIVLTSDIDWESGECKEFPSSSNEIACPFIGFSESVGHPMTYKVMTSDTKKVIYCSHIRLASEYPNPCAYAAARMNPSSPSSDNSTSETFDDHSTTPVLQSRDCPMAVIEPNDIIGRTYLSTPEEDGARMRLQIVEAIDNRAENADGTYEEVQTINQILEKIEEEDGEDNKTVVDSSANPASKLSKRHLSQSEGGNSSWLTELYIYSRLYQPGRYSEQSMGISSCMAHAQGTLILGRQYHVNRMSP